MVNHSLSAYPRKPIQNTNELSDVTHHPNIGTSTKFDFSTPLTPQGSGLFQGKDVKTGRIHLVYFHVFMCAQYRLFWK